MIRKVTLTTTHNDGKRSSITINVDYSGLDNETIMTWVDRNRAIAFQSPKFKAWPASEAEKVFDGYTVKADKVTDIPESPTAQADKIKAMLKTMSPELKAMLKKELK